MRPVCDSHLHHSVLLVRCTNLVRLMVCAALLSAVAPLHAEENCATAVARATRSYESGNLRAVESICKPCVDSLPPDERWQLYRLLALVYVFRDRQPEADTALDAMLRLHPLYEGNSDRDPAEFLEALTAYDRYPQLSITGRAAGNLASPMLLRSYSLDAVDPMAATYSGSLGTAFALGAEYHLGMHFAVTAEAMYQTSSFTRSAVTGYKFSTEYSERLSYAMFPIGLKYQLGAWSVAPVLVGGAYVQAFPSATNSIVSADGLTGMSASSAPTGASDRRALTTAGLYFGAGAEYPVPGGQLAITVRYYQGLTDVTSGAQRYRNSELLYGSYFIDDDFAMRNVEVSLAYIFHLTYRAYRVAQSE